MTELDDLSALTPTASSKLAGGFTILGGGFTLIASLQGFMVWRLEGLILAVLLLLLALGGAHVVLGFKVVRMRGWAARTATFTSGFAFLVGAAWFAFGIYSGLFSLPTLALIPLTGAASILCSSVIKPALKADALRAKLAEQGISSGI